VTALCVFATALAVPGSAAAKPLGSRALRTGMTGPDVKSLQRDLTEVGLPTPAVGSYGPETQRNVRTFEKEYGLRTDGVASRNVIQELKAALSAGGASTYGSGGTGIGFPTVSPTTKKTAKQVTDTPVVKQDGGSQHLGERTLHQGMKGHDVRVLQSYLTLVGFATNVDGSFGASTKTSVMQFEQTHLLTADGVVTYGVQVVLRQAVAQALAGGTVGKATINSDGTASAPAGAPAVVQNVIAAANQIIDKPYIYAGGHSRWVDNGYDCSGSVSYALHGGGLLSSPEDSTGLESWGQAGPGKWITVYADAAHTWVVVAGIAFDTADFGGPNIPSGDGPRWRRNPTGNLADGGNYVIRHPAGL
jgi:peptidoglycan hydrolase-like protein with peptidoglycan-binding domain